MLAASESDRTDDSTSLGRCLQEMPGSRGWLLTQEQLQAEEEVRVGVLWAVDEALLESAGRLIELSKPHQADRKNLVHFLVSGALLYNSLQVGHCLLVEPHFLAGHPECQVQHLVVHTQLTSPVQSSCRQNRISRSQTGQSFIEVGVAKVPRESRRTTE